jgi:hypothetical protein
MLFLVFEYSKYYINRSYNGLQKSIKTKTKTWSRPLLMPVVKTTKQGKVAYKWGSSGRAYTGPGARQKAEAQGRAAYAAGYRKK